MGYHFKRHESVPEAAKRIALEEFQSTADLLGKKSGRNRGHAIHEARKSVKKLRALLRLIQFELGGGTYRSESADLREAGSKLSELRDAAALVEIFDSLKEKFPVEFKGGSLASIRRGLAARKERAEHDADVAGVLRRIAARTRTAVRRVKSWPIRTHGFPAIQAGFEDSFRQGRQAFARARKHPSADNFHEWRKRVKDHWYHVRLLENLWTEVMQGYENSLRDLEGWLGDDHNLSLLRERLLAEPDAYGKPTAIDAFLHVADGHQKELRGNAVSLGRRIYREKPKQFAGRMRQLWDDWKAEPRSLEDFDKQQTKRQKRRPIAG